MTCLIGLGRFDTASCSSSTHGKSLVGVAARIAGFPVNVVLGPHAELNGAA